MLVIYSPLHMNLSTQLHTSLIPEDISRHRDLIAHLHNSQSNLHPILYTALPD